MGSSSCSRHVHDLPRRPGSRPNSPTAVGGMQGCHPSTGRGFPPQTHKTRYWFGEEGNLETRITILLVYCINHFLEAHLQLIYKCLVKPIDVAVHTAWCGDKTSWDNPSVVLSGS